MIIDIDVRYSAYGFDFVWSKTKAFEIRRDRGISFLDVVDVFIDQHAITTPLNEIPGSNYAKIGYSHTTGDLYVAFCYLGSLGSNEPIRLITARKIRTFERDLYVQNIQRNFVESLKYEILLDKKEEKVKKAEKAKKKRQKSLAVKREKQDE